MPYKSLLLLLSVCMLTQAGGDKDCKVTDVRLQAFRSGSRVEGKFNVTCKGGELPLCAEMISRHFMQDLMCSALGLQYSGKSSCFTH